MLCKYVCSDCGAVNVRDLRYYTGYFCGCGSYQKAKEKDMVISKRFKELKEACTSTGMFFDKFYQYGAGLKHITEFGVQGVVSTWAWLHCYPKVLRCYDLFDPWHYKGRLVKCGLNREAVFQVSGNIEEVKEAAKEAGIDFKFIKASTLEVEIEPTDLLFIDTNHSYDQLAGELKLHGGKVRKYIVMHDTFLYGYKDEKVGMVNGKLRAWVDYDGKGLIAAIDEYLAANPEWKRIEEIKYGTGLTILGKE